jgi:hypothetical protein
VNVVSFYTEGGGSSYQLEAKILRDSLDRFGIPHDIRAVQAWGDWYDHTAHKADFIAEMRRTMTGPLLWIDTDAVVHSDPTAYFEMLAAEYYDFGAHYFSGPAKGYDRTKVRGEGWRLLSGTTFWGDTPKAHQLADAWVALNRTLRGVGIRQGGGQKNLWYLTTCMAKEGLRVARLPGRYCYVFDKAWAYPEDEPRVIEHTIASRDHRAIRRETRERKARIEELQRSAAS